MGIVLPNESPQYRTAREVLLAQEVELRALTERVAQARRELPPGGEVPEDYVFQQTGADGQPADVRLSQLFTPGRQSLAIYSFMFARTPCPCCTALLDQLDAAELHMRERVDFAVVAKASVGQLAAFAAERGWRHLRLLSSAGNTFNRDYHAETAEGAQRPMLTVFRRDGDGDGGGDGAGAVRHFWSSELFYAASDPGQDPRHVGTLEPLWNMFDFTPEGRPDDWEEQLSYS